MRWRKHTLPLANIVLVAEHELIVAKLLDLLLELGVVEPEELADRHVGEVCRVV